MKLKWEADVCVDFRPFSVPIEPFQMDAEYLRTLRYDCLSDQPSPCLTTDANPRGSKGRKRCLFHGYLFCCCVVGKALFEGSSPPRPLTWDIDTKIQKWIGLRGYMSTIGTGCLSLLDWKPAKKKRVKVYIPFA